MATRKRTVSNEGAPLVPVERIEQAILLLRGEKVLLDRHLASLYNVKPIALRQQVKHNKNRFPEDFMFQLTRPTSWYHKM